MGIRATGNVVLSLDVPTYAAACNVIMMVCVLEESMAEGRRELKENESGMQSARHAHRLELACLPGG